MAAGLVAALVGLFLAVAPQPLTDLWFEWDLLPAPEQEAVLVVMPADATPGAWRNVAGLLREQGVAASGLVGGDVPDLPGVVTWRYPESPLRDAGFHEDWDGRSRTWTPTRGGEPTFPARLLAQAGRPVPEGTVRLPLLTLGVPTLDHAQLGGLAPGALTGRIVVVGSADPWTTPFVALPALRLPLAEVTARAVSGPFLPVPPPWLLALAAAAVGVATSPLLQASRRGLVRLGTGILAAAVLLGASALLALAGVLLPAEVLLGGLVAAMISWWGATWIEAHGQLQRVLDHVVGRLAEGWGGTGAAANAPWQALVQAAVSWGGAEAAWTWQQTRRGLRGPRTAAGGRPGEPLPTLQDVPPVPTQQVDDRGRSLLLVPIHGHRRILGLLVARYDQEVPAEAREALVNAAGHAAAVLEAAARRARTRQRADDGGVQGRLHELASTVEQVLEQRDLLLSASEDGRTAHALFDPLGRPVHQDRGFRGIVERLGAPPEASLLATWETLQLTREPLLLAAAGRGPQRVPVQVPGTGLDAWIYPCTRRDRVVALGLELVDVSELQAQDTVKSGLLEMVSYRVHNILAAIRGYADLLSLGAVDVDEVAPRIAARCGEMAEIFSRYENVTRPTEVGAAEPVQLIDLLQEVVAGARRTLGEHRVRLVDTPVALPPVLVERQALARGLMTLVLEVARDLPDDEPVLVELSAQSLEVEVRVRARGHGPPLEVLLQAVAEHRQHGSSLARRLVEEMGGRFRVEGGGDRGVLYRLCLPEA